MSSAHDPGDQHGTLPDIPAPTPMQDREGWWHSRWMLMVEPAEPAAHFALPDPGPLRELKIIVTISSPGSGQIIIDLVAIHSQLTTDEVAYATKFLRAIAAQSSRVAFDGQTS